MNNSRTSTKSKNQKKPTNKNNVKKKITSSSTKTAPKKKVTTKKPVAKTSVKKPVSKTTSKPVKKVSNNAPKKVVKKVAPQPQPVKKKVVQEQPKVKEKPKKVKIKPVIDEEKLNVIDVEGYEKYNERVEKIRKEVEEPKREINYSPKLILSIAFSIALIFIIGYVMFTYEYFNLGKISVSGNTKYDDKKVIANCSLTMGENVFKQLFVKEYNKQELPYISKVKYSYYFPNEIVIKVEERYPEYIAKDKHKDKYYMVDNQGYLLEETKLENKREELLVEGFSFENMPQYGKKIDEVYLKKIERFKRIKQLIKEADISTNVTKVNFDASLTIITIDDKLNVVFSNDSDFEYKVSFLKSIINKNGGIVEGTIDMSMENPIYSKYY